MTVSQRPRERPILALATEEQQFGLSVCERERPAESATAAAAGDVAQQIHRFTHRLLEETGELPAHVDPRGAHQMSVPLGVLEKKGESMLR